MTDRNADRKQLEQITAAWEEYDKTGDVSVIADYLAEDIIFMPPGESPVVGKETAVEWLGPSEEGNNLISQRAEDILIGGDLAVVWITVTGSFVPDDDGEPVEISLKGLDVYRRDADGKWEQIITIWNDQA